MVLRRRPGEAEVAVMEIRLGHAFADPQLLVEALVHPVGGRPRAGDVGCVRKREQRRRPRVASAGAAARWRRSLWAEARRPSPVLAHLPSLPVLPPELRPLQQPAHGLAGRRSGQDGSVGPAGRGAPPRTAGPAGQVGGWRCTCFSALVSLCLLSRAPPSLAPWPERRLTPSCPRPVCTASARPWRARPPAPALPTTGGWTRCWRWAGATRATTRRTA